LNPSAVAAGIEAMPPVYKQDFVKQPEWTSFNNAVAALPGITPTQQFVFSENFAAEGGITARQGRIRTKIPRRVGGQAAGKETPRDRTERSFPIQRQITAIEHSEASQ
jgi:hypothetical protein